MFDEEERAYFARRAASARARAAEATNPSIRKIHADMAEEYERRANGEMSREYLRQDPIPLYAEAKRQA